MCGTVQYLPSTIFLTKCGNVYLYVIILILTFFYLLAIAVFANFYT
jgi:hypothetical protein